MAVDPCDVFVYRLTCLWPHLNLQLSYSLSFSPCVQIQSICLGQQQQNYEYFSKQACCECVAACTPSESDCANGLLGMLKRSGFGLWSVASQKFVA